MKRSGIIAPSSRGAGGGHDGAISYSIPAACEITGLSRASLYLRIKDGTLVARKVGRRTIIARRDIERFVAALPAVRR